MKTTRFRALVALGAFAGTLLTSTFAADDVRFTKSLAPSELTEAGLQRLNSDQAAVLDALVRRDVAASNRPTSSREPRAAKFTERLTATERTNAGLAQLSTAELAVVDNFVARLTMPLSVGSGSFSTGSAAGSVTSATLRRTPEIHGEISLMYGVGSGGYSERGGAMVLTYDDPSGISLAVGYSEIRSKGGYYLRDYRDRYYNGYNPLWR